MTFIYSRISENRQIILIQMLETMIQQFVRVCFSFYSQYRRMIRAHVLAKTLRLFAMGQEKKYIEERSKHKMVENVPGLINKSNYRSSWTRVLVVATNSSGNCYDKAFYGTTVYDNLLIQSKNCRYE